LTSVTTPQPTANDPARVTKYGYSDPSSDRVASPALNLTSITDPRRQQFLVCPAQGGGLQGELAPLPPHLAHSEFRATGKFLRVGKAALREPAEDCRFAGSSNARTKDVLSLLLQISAKPHSRPRPLRSPSSLLRFAPHPFGLRSVRASLRVS